VRSTPDTYPYALGRVLFEYVVLGLVPVWMVGSFAVFGDAGPLWAERIRDGSLITFAIVILVVETRDRLLPVSDTIDRMGVWVAGLLAAAFLIFYAQLTTIDAQKAIADRDQGVYSGIEVSETLRLRSGVVAAALAVCFALVMAMRSVVRARLAKAQSSVASGS
jgi:hypothetical protein